MRADIEEMTLNAITLAWPDTLGVLGDFGLDTCCGGALPLREAVRRHGLELEAVVKALEPCLGRAAAASEPRR